MPLKIKWPNDIFYENNAKLGGILVKSSIMSENLTVQIGKFYQIDKNIFIIQLLFRNWSKY